MSNLSLFLKKNKIQKQNTFFAATKSLCDEKGEPLLWEIRAISTAENDQLREECTIEVPIKGKPNMYRPKVNTSKYIGKMLAASELQDSYGVNTPEDLLKQMIDNPAEYNDFANFIQNFSGFDTSMDDKVAEAKN